jgi:hypothetical protein
MILGRGFKIRWTYFFEIFEQDLKWEQEKKSMFKGKN